MRTLMGPEAHVSYWQIYVQSVQDEDWPDVTDFGEAFAGQSNGICGAAVPGALFLRTGLHSGKVGFTVEWHDSRPPADDSWDEIVEASFRHDPASQVMLVTWGGEDSWPLDLTEADYRVRYCAAQMDEAYEADTRLDDEPQVDTYLLQFWPDPAAAAEPDEVIKQTSEIAIMWHGYARSLPPPPTPEERAARAAAEERARAEREREQQRAVQESIERHLWGEFRPSERLRGLDGAATALARLDPGLVGALDVADPDTQRRVACWAAHRACAEARLTTVGPVAAALTALDRGEPLPPPFDEDSGLEARSALRTDPAVPRTQVTSISGTANFSQQSLAFTALRAAGKTDPLDAVTDTLWQAANAFGRDRYGVLLEEVRQAFPGLSPTPGRR
jgi:hypothetical protein